jgi:PAS domain S-box-containing protein
MRGPDLSRVRAALGFVLYLVAYAAGYRYGMAFGHDTASPFWFPDSIVLCALLLTRPRWWALLILSTLPIRLATAVPIHTPQWFLVTTFAIDAAKAVTVATLLRTGRKDFYRIESVREFAWYGLFAVLLVPALASFAGAAARLPLGNAYWPTWERWFLGDALAQLVVTPILLYWFLRPDWRPSSRPSLQSAEAALVAIGMIGSTYLAFDPYTTASGFSDSRFYAPVPFMFWAAIRFGMLGATGVIGVLTLFSVSAALHGSLAGASPAETALALQDFLAIRAAPLYLVAVLTQQKDHAESSLRESEQRFRMMADTAPVMIWMTDTSMQCTFANQSWLKFAGHTLDEELGDGWIRSIHPDDLAACLEVCQIASSARKPFTVEYRARRHDGTYRWVLDSGVPRYAPSGEFTGYVGSAIDITDRYVQELALRESEERYREVVECQTDLVCRFLPDTTLTFVNDAYCRFFQRDRESLLGTTFLLLLPESMHQTARDEIALAVALQQRRDSDTEVIMPDGRVGWQHWTAFPLVGPSGRVEELQGIGHDITDRKRLEETQRELAHASRLAVVGELTAMVAHELRQPLTAIMSNAEAARGFLRRSDPPLDEIRDILADICESDQRASEAIIGLRALVNRRDIQMQSVDVNETVSVVLRLADGDSKRRRVTVRAELAPFLPPVLADPIHIQQVLLNLVVNGLDATEHARDARRELIVRTSVHGADGVEVEVTDNGSGIPVEKLPQIFQAFFTTKRDGMGIGLAIARSIIETHGGSIWAENNTAGGASFRFVLPVATPDRLAAAVATNWSTVDEGEALASR